MAGSETDALTDSSREADQPPDRSHHQPHERPQRPSVARWRRLDGPTTVVAVAAALAAALIASIVRRFYFFGDEWAFLLHRQLSWTDLMRPHNEHWTTLPVLTYRTMFRLFGIDHYFAYALMPVVLHLACGVLLFRVMRRNEVPAWPSAIAVVPFLFLVGNIGENPLWAFQIGFLGSAVLGLIGLLVSADARSRGLVATWAALVLGLMCSGMALPMAGWVCAYVLLLHGVRRAVLTGIVPLAVYALWYVGYGSRAGDTPRPTAAEYLDFLRVGLTSWWDQVIGISGIGGPVVIGLAALALLGRLTVRQRALALSALIGLCATYAVIGLSRAGYGVDFALSSRYGYFAALMTLPSFALALGWAGRRMSDRRTQRAVTATVLMLAMAGIGVAQTLTYGATRLAQTEGLRAQLLGAIALIDSSAPLLNESVSPTYNPDVVVSALDSPQVRDALPPGPPSRTGLFDASLALQVAARPQDLQLPQGDPSYRLLVGDRSGPGCHDLVAQEGARLTLPARPGGSQLQLVVAGPAITVRLVGERVSSAKADLAVTPGQPTWVGSTSTLGALRIDVPAGPVQVCPTT